MIRGFDCDCRRVKSLRTCLLLCPQEEHAWAHVVDWGVPAHPPFPETAGVGILESMASMLILAHDWPFKLVVLVDESKKPSPGNSPGNRSTTPQTPELQANFPPKTRPQEMVGGAVKQTWLASAKIQQLGLPF